MSGSSAWIPHDQTYHNIVKRIVDKGIVFYVNNNIYYGNIHYLRIAVWTWYLLL